jgi:hypothetical protein
VKEDEMKYIKILSLAAIAAMALMAFGASSASATALYNGATKLGVGSEVRFSLKFGSSLLLVSTENETLDTCKSSSIWSQLRSAGGSGQEVETYLTSMSLGSCTFSTSTVSLGDLDYSWTSGTNALVRTFGFTEVTINTVFFGSCIYGVQSGSTLGTLKTASSGSATLDVNAVATKRSGSNFACPTTSVWTAEYVSTTPVNLRVEAS